MKALFFWIFCLFSLTLAAQKLEIDFLDPAHRIAYEKANSLFKKKQFELAESTVDQLVNQVRKDSSGIERDLILPLLLKANCWIKFKKDTGAIEALFQEICQIAKRELRGRDETQALLLETIGSTLDFDSKFSLSEKYFLQAIQIWQSLEMPKNFEYAEALTLTGAHFYRKQDYENAERYYLRAKTLWESGLDTISIDYSDFLNYFGSLQKAIGVYEEAEITYLKCLSIRERRLGSTDKSCAQPLTNLAQLHQVQEQYERAIPYFLRAMEIRRKYQVEEPEKFALTINNYATLLRTLERFDEAESLFMEAIVIRAKNPNLLYISSLNGLALLYKMTKRYTLADSLFRVCLNARENMLGKETPDYLLTLRYMIDLHARMNRFDWVDEELAQEMRTQSAILHKSARFLPEKDLTSFAASYERNLASYLSYCIVRGDNIGFNTGICYNDALLYKGFVLNHVKNIRTAAIANPETQKLYESLMEARADIAYEYARPAKLRSRALSRMQSKANDLEKALTRQVVDLEPAEKLIIWRDVQANLKPRTAAIEFVEFLKVYPDVTDTVMYAALVLLPGKSEPEFIVLCTKKQLSELIKRQAGPLHQRVNQLYAAQPSGVTSLYDLLWAPIQSLLNAKRINTVFYAPAGLIHRINLAAISQPGGTGKIMSDRFQLILVESTRKLAYTNPATIKPVLKDAVVYGGVYYKMDSVAISKANQSIVVNDPSPKTGETSLSLRSVTSRFDSTPYLPATRREAIFIDSLFKAHGLVSTLKLGFAATEESFKILGAKHASPGIIHIGTHGFFAPDASDSLRIKRADLETVSTFESSDQPLIRSGLKLAGADYAWKNEHNLEGLDDGILTAYEVSQLNLSNTQLVFLSACETGLGDINGNEGVYGLQRSFKMAGASNLVMSLWKVNDEATAMLAGKFYENLMLEKKSIRESFEEAQSWLRVQPGFEAPFFWAGFVLLGD